MRVKVNDERLDAIREPEHVAVGSEYDDFCIDENAGVAYLTAHCENTIDYASLNPARNSNRFIVAGYPLNEELIAPSSAAWGRLSGGYAKVAFVTNMRVKVNDEMLDAIGEPEHVAVGSEYDDFCIAENAGVAYLTTHCENTIDTLL